MSHICHIIAASIVFSMAAEAGVWAHYPFDENFYDESGNFRDGVLIDNGTPDNSVIVSTPGDFKFGTGAMNFSEDRDYLDVPMSTFSSGSPYTIAFWARKTAGDTGQAANWDMVIGDRTGTNFFIGLNDVTGTGMRWRGFSSAPERQQDFAVPMDYEWHHYAIVASGTTISLYLDGEVFGSFGGKLTGFQFNTIGDAYPDTSDYDFHGQIDEMWIFDEALDADSIVTLHAINDAYAAPPFAGIHHRYDGDFTDSGSEGNDGTPEGAAATTTDPAGIAAGNGALSLDGADGSRVALAMPGSYSSSESWTVAWWARMDQPNAGMVMGTAETTTDFIWLNAANGGLRFRSSGNITFDFNLSSDTSLHHYALVADGAGALTLYRDGQFVDEQFGDTAFKIDSIGKAYPTTTLHYNFSGYLDEIHVMPSALDATGVEQLYDDEKPDVIDPPVTRLRIVLLGGQSNADGRATVASLPTSPVNLQAAQADVSFFYKIEGSGPMLTTLQPGLTETSQFGPEITLGRKMADLWDHEDGTRVAIIKYANGGTNLAEQWKGGGDATTTGDGPEYVIFQQTVDAGLAALGSAYPGASLDLQGMVWMQGEGDANASMGPGYGGNLTTFIADVRATFGADLPFTIARLSSGQTHIDPTYLAQIRSAQDAVAAADPRTGLLDTDGFGMGGDNLHFNASGQQSLGAGFAAGIAYLEWVVDTFPPADIDAGLAEPGVDRDGDGKSNHDEFLGATDPLSALSRFQATFSFSGPATGEVAYPSSAARAYNVEQLNETGTGWESGLPALRGTGAPVSRSLEASASRGIYRVRAELP